ncbi:unnamed protein product [Periconia digitata]|uniref:Uncharacterized protein n=1 Tax=Periconia digitata TaxID=1303443 RepID=A0A9W4UDE4_9PLEO|nr:unnamed protein product [Periconia digitata]
MKDRLDSENSHSCMFGSLVSSRIISCNRPRPWSTLPANVPRTKILRACEDECLDAILHMALPKSVLY